MCKHTDVCTFFSSSMQNRKKVQNKTINVTFTGNSKIYFSQMPIMDT